MRTYVFRRLLLAIPTLIGLSLLVFLIMRVAPGDVAVMMLGGQGGVVGRPEELIKLRQQLGLDRPLYIQYLSWVWDIVTFDFGVSYFLNTPVGELLARKLPLSAQIGVMGLVIGSVLGVVGGVVAALKQDSWVDYLIRGLAVAGLSLPTFWIGMIIILVLVRFFDWSPEIRYTPFWEDPARNLAQTIWPAIVISVGFLLGTPLRMMRATLLEVLREDYIRTARAKGLSERIVIVRHAIRNAMIPVVTIIGVFLPLIVSGLVVTEQVFGLPGIGRMMVDAISQRDYPVVQVLVMLEGAAVVIGNLAVDLLYGWLDPRIRYD